MQGKKRYLALILFIVIGLIGFTFANPNEELEPVESNVKKVAENKPEKEAEKAVEKAELRPSTETVEEAEEIIEESVTLNPVVRQELTERLEVVEEAIDASELVATVERMVEESENKDDILASEYYFDLNDIERITGNMNPGDVRDNLEDRIEYLNDVFNDNTAPIVEGIEDGEITKNNVKITITDTTTVTTTVTLNNKIIEFAEEFNEEGVYTITVVDAAHNPTTKTFTIDKTAPKFEGLASREVDTEYYKVDITDITNVVITIQKDFGQWIEIEEGYELIEEGTYQLKAVDAANTSFTTWIHIDKTKPTIEGINNNEHTNKCVSISAFDRYLNTVEVDGTKYTRKGVVPFEHNSQNENFKFVYPTQICDVGTHTIIARDKSGKDQIVTFTIDKTKPQITGVENGAYYNHDVTPVIIEENLQNVAIFKDDKKYTKYTVGMTLTEEGVYRMRASDKAGNKFDYITFTIDKTAPTARSNWWKKTLEADKTATFTDFPVFTPSEEATVEYVRGEVNMGKPGVYRIRYRITDLAKNSKDYEVQVTVVDTTAPTTRSNWWKKTVEADKNATFTDFPQFTTSDNAEGEIKIELVSGEVNMAKPGVYRLRYRFTDESGNAKDYEVQVTVKETDTEAPTISLIGDENVILAMGETYIEPGVKVSDNIDGETTSTSTTKIELYTNNQLVGTVDTIDTAIAGKYVLTYQTKDAAGNVSNIIQRTVSIYANVIRTVEDLKVLFSSFDNIKNKTVILTNDIDMSNVTDWKPIMGVDGYTFTLDGNGHKISNLVYETNKKYAGLFFEGMDSGDVTINNLTIENSKVTSTASDSYVGLIGGYIDVINSVNINNVNIINSEVNSTNYAGAFLGWTAGYNTQNDGPVDGIVNITNCSVKGTKVIGGGSAGLATGHAGANPGTYTTIKNFVAEDNIIKGERVDKTGAIIGTANAGEVVLENITYNNNTVFDVTNSAKLVGRFVPNSTGKLTHIVDDEAEYIDAVNNSLKGQVIKLGKDLDFMDQTTTIAKDKTIILDLNGKTIDGKSTKGETSSLFTVKNNASLTIKGDGIITYEAGKPDTDWGGEGQREFPGYANNTIRNKSKLIIDGASIFNTTPSGGATFTIDNYPGADLIVEDGIVQQVGGATAIRMFANSATLNTKVTINGGKISGAAAVWLQLPSGNTAVAPKAELVINGGTFSSVKSSDAVYSYSYGNSHANTSVTITGGTFNNGVQFGYNAKNFYDDLKTLSITGGIFNSYVGKWTANHNWVDIEVPTNN